MVARKQLQRFDRVSRAPRPALADSDVLALALVTAQALEAQGEVEEAARWLRRAARQARRDGDLERCALIARAARDLAQGARRSTSPHALSPAAEHSPRRSFLRVTGRSERRTARPSPKARIFDLGSENPTVQRASVWHAMLELFGAFG